MSHILDKIINFVSNIFHIMDYLSLIKQPINSELNDFIELLDMSY